MIRTTIGCTITVMWISDTEFLLLQLTCVYAKRNAVLQVQTEVGAQ